MNNTNELYIFMYKQTKVKKLLNRFMNTFTYSQICSKGSVLYCTKLVQVVVLKRLNRKAPGKLNLLQTVFEKCCFLKE